MTKSYTHHDNPEIMNCRKIILLLMFLFELFSASAQNRQIGLELSWSRACLGYRYQFAALPFWNEIYAGLGNEDINRDFDDFQFGIKTGMSLFSRPRTVLYGFVNLGMYFPENNYYRANTPFLGAGTGIRKFFGKGKRQSIFTEFSYRYGHTWYTQSYNRDGISVKTAGKFRLQPVSISIGYGFRF